MRLRVSQAMVVAGRHGRHVRPLWQAAVQCSSACSAVRGQHCGIHPGQERSISRDREERGERKSDMRETWR